MLLLIDWDLGSASIVDNILLNVLHEKFWATLVREPKYVDCNTCEIVLFCRNREKGGWAFLMRFWNHIIQLFSLMEYLQKHIRGIYVRNHISMPKEIY